MWPTRCTTPWSTLPSSLISRHARTTIAQSSVLPLLQVLEPRRWNKIFFWTPASARNDSFNFWCVIATDQVNLPSPTCTRFYSDLCWFVCLCVDIPMRLRTIVQLLAKKYVVHRIPNCIINSHRRALSSQKELQAIDSQIRTELIALLRVCSRLLLYICTFRMNQDVCDWVCAFHWLYMCVAGCCGCIAVDEVISAMCGFLASSVTALSASSAPYHHLSGCTSTCRQGWHRGSVAV